MKKYNAAQARVSGARAGNSSGSSNKAAGANGARKSHANTAEPDDSSAFDSAGFSIASIGAAVAIAIVGAFLWKFIAMSTGTEWGLLAWAIGGAIGLGAAFFGANDNTEGVICAVVCVLAIAGGKYMIAGEFVDELVGDGGIQDYFAEAISQEYGEDVEKFALVGDDENSIKKFMVKTGYSESDHYQSVDDYEYESFTEFTMPLLRELDANPDDFANSPVLSELFFDEVDLEEEVFSQSAFFKEMWGPIDILFLVFGVLSAYQMANGRGSAILNR